MCGTLAFDVDERGDGMRGVDQLEVVAAGGREPQDQDHDQEQKRAGAGDSPG